MLRTKKDSISIPFDRVSPLAASIATDRATFKRFLRPRLWNWPALDRRRSTGRIRVCRNDRLEAKVPSAITAAMVGAQIGLVVGAVQIANRLIEAFVPTRPF